MPQRKAPAELSQREITYARDAARESYHECDFDTASAIELAEVRVRRWVGQDRLELAEQWVRQFIYFWHGSDIKPGIIPDKGEPGCNRPLNVLEKTKAAIEKRKADQ